MSLDPSTAATQHNLPANYEIERYTYVDTVISGHRYQVWFNPGNQPKFMVGTMLPTYEAALLHAYQHRVWSLEIALAQYEGPSPAFRDGPSVPTKEIPTPAPDPNSLPEADRLLKAGLEILDTMGPHDGTHTVERLRQWVLDWATVTFPDRSIDTVRFKLIQESGELVLALATQKWDDVADELADVLILLLDLTEMLQIDIATAIHWKMETNRSRTWEIDNEGLSYHV